MDAMIIGATIPKPDSAFFTVYTPWVARDGNGVTLSVEVVDSISIKVEIETKNLDDADSGATSLANASGSSGTVSVQATGLKELVRYKISTTELSVGVETGHIKALDPQWERN